MKDIVVSSQAPISPAEWSALGTQHSRFLDAFWKRNPPPHPDRIARQAVELVAMINALRWADAADRKTWLDARQHLFLPLEIPRYWMPVVEVLRHMGIDKRRLSVLDAGCGLGAGAVSVLLCLQALGYKGHLSLTVAEPERALLPTTREVLACAQTQADFPTTVNWSHSRVSDGLQDLDGEHFDIVLLNGAISRQTAVEVSSGDIARLVTKVLNSLVRTSGFLVLFELPLKRVSRTLSSVLESLKNSGYPTFAPCTTGGICPLLKSPVKFCFHSTPVPQNSYIQSAAGKSHLASHEIHYCYATLSPKRIQMEVPADGPGFSFGRVVSFPERLPHGFALHVCARQAVIKAVAQRMLPDGKTKGNRIPHGAQVAIQHDRPRHAPVQDDSEPLD